jgi:hypothetical protein
LLAGFRDFRVLGWVRDLPKAGLCGLADLPLPAVADFPKSRLHYGFAPPRLGTPYRNPGLFTA